MTVDRSAIEAARRRIEGRVRRTPVMEVDLGGVRVILKLELLQHTGSFKVRGAFNRVLAESSIPDAGLITASGGNHGGAVAHVAHELGVPAEVFVAEVTPAVKRDRIAALGAEVIVGGHQYPDALEASQRRAIETGALEIHAYDHPLTVAGQGTMGAELEEQVPGLSAVAMAVGGGGFAAGSAAWFSGRVPVICVEPEGSSAYAAARNAGHPVDVSIDSLAADSLGARRIGDVPFEALSAADSPSVLVSDDAIACAQRWFWEHMRLVVEPGGATAAAAILSGVLRPADDGATVVVVCGSNADPSTVMG